MVESWMGTNKHELEQVNQQQYIISKLNSKKNIGLFVTKKPFARNNDHSLTEKDWPLDHPRSGWLVPLKAPLQV